MADYYIIRSSQYAQMSTRFYEEYLAAKKMYDRVDEIFVPSENPVLNYSYKTRYLQQADDNAIASVVFQALAVEAYTNLWGMWLLGEEEFYANYDSKKRLSTPNKLVTLAEKMGKEFPTELKDRIERLFQKRNSFVHQKPKAYHFEVKPYDYKNPAASFDDIDAFIHDLSYAEEDLAAEMQIFADLQKCVQTLRGAECELIEEFGRG